MPRAMYEEEERIVGDTIDIRTQGYAWTLMRNDVLTLDLLKEGIVHEPHLYKFIESFVEEGDTVIDIGACFGYHTLHLSTKVGITGEVYAFEPQPNMFTLLRKNVLQNGFTNVHLYNVALGNIDKSVCMYNAYDGNTNYGDTFISWKYDTVRAGTDVLQHEQIGKGGKVLDISKLIAECKRLDAYTFSSIKFIKIDVQGFELFVLQGGENTIKTHRPVMVIEFEDICMNFHKYSTKELISYLKQIEYTVLFLDHTYPCDHVCVPNEKVWDFFQKYTGKIHPHNENNPINNNYDNGVREKLVL